MSEPFIAQIQMWACNYAPRSWAFCDGGVLPISENAALFSLIYTTYGGDGRTTVGLPDLQARAPIQQGRGPGLSNYVWGQRGGTSSVELYQQQMPEHTHTWYAQDDEASDTEPNYAYLAQAGEPGRGGRFTPTDIYSDAANLMPLSDSTIGNAGASQPHNNMQPFQVLNFCIALAGVFPSRS
ncbi:phage tail protein [Motiliproteus sp. MSK22-1]|uniref:phage tail protein n=1 Tax=Motiliproteus sp. MSK22-1 TaxID=1897630 RepID=UPI0009768E64|nr:tail fiber protein [Motiliproteus sp. MSK22-1]OMH33806.1 phage tail protein [Motiliproteus sp. MSK22-1]